MNFLGRRRSKGSRSTVAESVASQDKGKPRSDTKASAKSSNSRGSRPRKKKGAIDVLNNPDLLLNKIISAGLLGEQARENLHVDVRPHKVLKEGVLEKQGNVIKSWHRRYFVLRSRSLSYYESEKKYKAGAGHFGVIFFKDIISYNGQYVQKVPDLKMMRAAYRGKNHLFVVNKKDRMYIINASSASEKKEWEIAVSNAVQKYIKKKEEQARRKRERKESKENAAVRRKQSVEEGVFGNINNLEELDEEFHHALSQRMRKHKLSKTLLAWRVFTRYSKLHKMSKRIILT